MEPNNARGVRLARLVAGTNLDVTRITPSGDLWARCWFHEERTSNLFLSARSGRYRCFACGARGDTPQLLAHTRGLDLQEAIELLAKLQARADLAGANTDVPQQALAVQLGGLLESYAWAHQAGPRSLRTGFPRLDALAGGLRPGGVSLLTGPRVACTSFAMQLLLHVCLVLQRPAAYLSLDLAPARSSERLLATLARVHPSALGALLLDPAQAPTLRASCEQLAAAPLFLPERSPRTRESLASLARGLRRRQGLQLLVCDGVELSLRSGHPVFNSQVFSSETAKLARELDVHVLLLSHQTDLPRLETQGASERVHDGLPSWLDKVLRLSRPQAPGGDRGARELRLEVLRNLCGPLGVTQFEFDPESLLLSEA